MSEDNASAPSRRLAAILAADVVGYSALMAADEEATVRDLKSLQAAILSLVAQHRGNLVDTAGDGVLAEFPSVLNAVKCALAIQEDVARRNAGVEPGRAMRYRIGAEQGDVLFDGARVYGDGINVASRLQALADPGGLCISGKVYDEVKDRIAATFEDLGEKVLKNIPRPVRVYAVRPGLRQDSASRLALPSPPPDKPSIAILPFQNMSADPEQEYFSDGITEDIITDISKIAGLLVVARNSSFAYKHKNLDVRTIARELGVTSVLEGSIRRAGNRVRITAQLIDAANGGHLRAERYDRDLTDIFAVQDEVTTQIVQALRVTLRPAERALLADNRTNNVEAHDCFLRGRELLLTSAKDRDVFVRMIAAFRRAIELDPAYAEPYAGLGLAYCQDFQNHWADTPDALGLAAHFAEQAIERGPNEPYAHYVSAVVTMWKRNLEGAKSAAEKALALNPNYAFAYATRGLIQVYLGHPLAAVPDIELAIRLDPAFTQQYMHFLGSAYLMAGQYKAAAAALRERIRLSPKTDLSRAFLASSLGHLGEIGEAKRVWQELKDINPKYSFEEHLARLPFQNQADAATIREGLARADLPD